MYFSDVQYFHGKYHVHASNLPQSDAIRPMNMRSCISPKAVGMHMHLHSIQCGTRKTWDICAVPLLQKQVHYE